MDRITSIDVCRGIAIISMITADIPVVKNVGMNIAIGIIRPCAGMFAAPFFLFIAGLSYELFVISRLERNRNTKHLNIETFWRAIILLAITQILFFSGVLFFPSKFSPGFNSSIFFVIAVGYLLSIFMPRKWIYHIPIILIPFILSYFLKSSTDGILSFLFSNPFPLMPFLSYFFAGRCLMIFYEQINDLNMQNRKIIIFSAVFIATIILVFQLFMLPITFNARTEILGFLLLIGIMTCILSMLSVYSNRFKGYVFFISPFERIGRIAFSVYYTFFALELIIFPYLNKTFIINFDPKFQILTYFLSIFFIIMTLSNIEKIWRKFGYKFGFEWVLRNGSAYFTKLSFKTFTLKF